MDIERINFLANKDKKFGLTEEEKIEQAALRKQFLDEFKKGFISTMDCVYVLDENGNKVKLKKKDG